MKFFLSFLQSEIQHPIPAYGFWEYYIKNGILEAGHNWAECPGLDWAFGLVPKSAAEQDSWKEKAWEQTISYLEKHRADIFLSYLYPKQIDTSAMKYIKKMGIPCVNFFCDNVREFKKIPDEFGVFDLNWVPEYKAAELYKKAQFPYINLPMPIWVDPALRILSDERNQQITFIGSNDIQRQCFLEESLQGSPELPLAVYGAGWEWETPKERPQPISYTFADKLQYQYTFLKENGFKAYARKLHQRTGRTVMSQALQRIAHGKISAGEYNKLTAESMITFGINRYPSYSFPIDRPDSYSRLRDIEAPMLGACYLTEYTEGMEMMYDLGAEIHVYQSVSDFLEQCKELQADAAKRKKLKINGQKRALHDHSIPISLNKILKKLG